MFNTLLIDGDSVFKRGFYGAKNMFNWKGEHVGGLYQFLVFLRRSLEETNYKKVYVLWDGKDSTSLRRGYYPEYKRNRKNKSGTFDKRGLLTEKDLILERYKVREYLEELFIRQFEYDQVEADDLIGYYCNNKDDDEVITICTADRDLLQLVSDTVKVFLTDKREVIDREAFIEIYGYIPENEVLIKALVGDISDNIKGVKGISTNTLLYYFSDIKNNIMTTDNILKEIENIQEERVNNKKKRSKRLDKIKAFIEDENGFKLNYMIMDLKHPILTDECKSEVDELFYLPLDHENRSIENLYKKLKRDGIDGTVNKRSFDFLIPFKELMEREKRNYKLNIKNE